jgi:hypothetical protein
MIARVAGALLLVVMAIHVVVRPEQGWILLSGCDVATVVTAVGLIAAWHRTVAISGLFQTMIGIPAFAVGVFTTYDINPTGIVIHVVPPILAAIVVAHHGMPRRAAAIAWCSYLVVFVAGYVFAPPALNVNFAAFVWPPLAHVFTTTLVFQLALLALVALLLAVGEIIALRLVDRARASTPARS